MIEALNLIQDHLFVSVFPAIQDAAIAALNSDQQTVRDLVNLYERRRNQFLRRLVRLVGNHTHRADPFMLGCLFLKGIRVKALPIYC